MTFEYISRWFIIVRAISSTTGPLRDYSQYTDQNCYSMSHKAPPRPSPSLSFTVILRLIQLIQFSTLIVRLYTTCHFDQV